MQEFDKEMDRHFQEALEAFENEPTPTHRKLRPNESVPVPEIGIPTACISGTDVEVDEYPDGSIIPILQAVGELIDIIMRGIVLRTSVLLPVELVFLRRQLKLTQSELAELLDIQRETVSRMETGAAKITAQVSATVRFHCLLHLISRLPNETRQALSSELRRVQEAITAGGAANTEHFKSYSMSENEDKRILIPC